MLLHYLRLWDYRTAGGVDAFAANSAYIARRIMKVYRREAEVIYLRSLLKISSSRRKRKTSV